MKRDHDDFESRWMRSNVKTKPLLGGGKRRSKKPIKAARSVCRVELRCTDVERDRWIKASQGEGYLSLSDWMRDRLNAAARLRTMLSSDVQTFNTPEVVLKALESLGPIGLDPCSNETSIVNARVSWTVVENGLGLISWEHTAAGALIYVNPPFNELPEWVRRIIAEAAHGAEIVLCAPARVDTQWFAACLEAGGTAALWKGRITFRGAANSAPFPLALIYFGPRVQIFRSALASYCRSFAVDHRFDPRQTTLLIGGRNGD